MRLQHSRTVYRMLILAVMLFMVLGADRSGQIDSEIPDISKRINEFTVDLLQQLAGEEGSPANTMLSPQSIFHGMAMSYIASGGETRRELSEVLHFPAENEQLINDLARLRGQLNASDRHRRIEVDLANSAWLDERYGEFRKEYLRAVQKSFEASLNRVNFKQAEQVSDDINRWISDQTRGKIQEGISPEDLKSKSRAGKS